MHMVKRVSVILLVLVLALAGLGYGLWTYALSLVNKPTETAARTDGGTTATARVTVPLTNPVPEEKGVKNILLLGVDNRVTGTDDNESNSDVMMIVTIDMDNDTVKLTSLQRDMAVYIPGFEQPRKLTEAHFDGGAARTMQTLNENFRLGLSDYVEVNIYESERLIDIVGGIELDVENDIIWQVNQCIGNQNLWVPESEEAPYLTQGGLQHLNGRQAVGYARVRAYDGGDYNRMGRQRKVLQAVFDAFLKANIVKKSTMITEGLKCIYTSLSNTEITKLALNIAPTMKNEIQQKQVPDHAKYGIEYIETTDYFIRVDLNGVIPGLHQFIYNRVEPFDPVRPIPGAPNSPEGLPPGIYEYGKAPPVAATTASETAAPTEPTAPPTEPTTAPPTAAATTAATAATTPAATTPAATTAAATTATTAVKP